MQKKFIYIFWISVFVLLIYIIHIVIKINEQQKLTPKVNQTEYQNAVILKPYNHQYITYGYINDHKVIFLIDTGASSVSIPGTIAKKLNLKKGLPFQASTANGTVTVYHSVIKKLTIGNITLENITANINPSYHSHYILLGMSALKFLEIQQKNNQLILIQSKQ